MVAAGDARWCAGSPQRTSRVDDYSDWNGVGPPTARRRRWRTTTTGLSETVVRKGNHQTCGYIVKTLAFRLHTSAFRPHTQLVGAEWRRGQGSSPATGSPIGAVPVFQYYFCGNYNWFPDPSKKFLRRTSQVYQWSYLVRQTYLQKCI